MKIVMSIHFVGSASGKSHAIDKFRDWKVDIESDILQSLQ